MKIAWFTALRAGSPASAYSVALCEALAESCEVEIWALDAPPWRSAPVRTRDARERRDAGGDVVPFYNVGDETAHCLLLHERSIRHPGIFLLHDGVPSMVAGRASGAREDARPREHTGWEASDQRAEPLLRSIDRALGIVVHTETERRMMEERRFGPVGRIHVPAPTLQRAVPDVPRRRRVELLTMGATDGGAAAELVVRCLGRDGSLRAAAHLTVLTSPDHYDATSHRLLPLTVDYGLEGVVEIVSGDSGGLVAKHLRRADVCVDLRDPSLESMAALMLQLARAKPVIAAAVGFAAEIPGVVETVAPGDEAHLGEVLGRLVADPDARRQLASNGRAFAERHTPSASASELLAFLEVAAAWRPFLDLADRVATELHRLGLGASAAAIGPIAHEVGRLATR